MTPYRQRTDHRAMDGHDPKCATFRALPDGIKVYSYFNSCLSLLSKPIFVGNISPRKESPGYCEKGVSTKGHSNSPVSKFHDLDKQSTGSPSSGRRNAIHSCLISILNPIWSYSDCIKKS